MISPTLAPDLVVNGLTAAERDTVAQYIARLHDMLPPEKIRSVILYGSKARGDAHAHSDVDLLVVHYDLTPEQEEALLELDSQWCIELTGTATLQIFPQSYAQVMEMENIGEPLAQNIQRDGIVMEGEPIVVKKVEKIQISQRELATAQKSIAVVELLVQSGFYDDAVSKAYYVFLHSARAALVARNFTPSSHEGTNSLFGLHLVKPGLVPKKFGNLYGKMLKDRLQADYKREYEFTREDAERALERARELLAIIENLLPQLLAEA